MVNKDDLRKRYEKLSNGELMEMLDNPQGYTELAVSVAEEVFSKRDVTEKDVAQYRAQTVSDHYSTIDKNFIDDLGTGQKLFFFYFFWIDWIGIGFKGNFIRDGFELKYSHARYFELMGVLSMVVTVFLMLVLNLHSFFQFLLFGVAGLIFLYYDISVRKPKRLETHARYRAMGHPDEIDDYDRNQFQDN